MNVKKIIIDVLNEIFNSPSPTITPTRPQTPTRPSEPRPRPNTPNPIKIPRPGPATRPKAKKKRLKSHDAFMLNRAKHKNNNYE
jgi:hypothetical protein